MALLIHTYELGEKELDSGGSCKECKSQLRESSYWRMYSKQLKIMINFQVGS